MLLCVPSFPEFLQFLTCICVSVGGSRAQTERGSAEVRQVQGGDRDVDGLDEEDERDARGTETDVDWLQVPQGSATDAAGNQGPPTTPTPAARQTCSVVM